MDFKIEGEMLIDGEVIIDTPTDMAPDYLNRIQWRTKNWDIIYVKDMADGHLRNAALFLMGFGVTKCYASEKQRVIYLRIFLMEWERRMATRAVDGITTWKGVTE